jgi:hypothetical protein
VSPKASEITIINKDALSRSASASSSPRSYESKPLETRKDIKPVFGQAKNFRKQYNPRAARLEKEKLRK